MHVVHFVKKFIVVFFIVSFITNTPLEAVQASTVDRQALLERIAFLTAQVQKLQQQLASLTTQTGSLEKTGFSYKTKFYTGVYEALYYVQGDDLVRQNGQSVRSGDQMLWDTLLEIAGETFAGADISEFRIYNDLSSDISAFVEEKPDNTWILGFNREGSDIATIHDSEPIIKLLLHEYAHPIFFEKESITNDFKKEFWGNKKDQQYHSSNFVSEYATTNAVEDLVESFVSFVMYDKPNSTSLKDKKVQFFYAYPSLVTLRNELRKSEHF